ncbi:MAG TPA: hypothetical protein VFP91_17165, partial [Vicinamibacterales bacterium]|nr:hypothetical protein [Vicinamibacterales bacterium]
TQIRHNPVDASPDAGERYRCHVCRLELQFDVAARTFIVVPLDTDHDTDPTPPPRQNRRRR